jgi:tRNA (adenine22-N1)-methyltransferase
MPKISLSHRLQSLFDMVDPEVDYFYDLCCDHGKLGFSVFYNKRPKQQTVLNDQIIGICEQIQTFIDTYIPNSSLIKVTCQKAQAIEINPNVKNFITIAGIGGPLLLEILDSLNLNPSDTLLLSPHTKIHEVRKYLHDKNFSLIEERLIREDHQFYEMLKVTPNQEGEPVSLIGKAMWDENSDINKSYLLKNLNYFEIQDQYHPSDFVKLYLSLYKALKFPN